MRSICMKKYCILSFLVCFAAILLIGCAADLPTDDHKTMLEIADTDQGAADSSPDSQSGENWTVYYDGCVEYYEEPFAGGAVNACTWSIDEKQLGKLYKRLSADSLRYSEDVASACGGMGYSFTLYDENGNVRHTFSGYIEDLIEIVNSGKASGTQALDPSCFMPVNYSGTEWVCDEIDWDSSPYYSITVDVDDEGHAFGLARNYDDSEGKSQYLYIIFQNNTYEAYAVDNPDPDAYRTDGSCRKLLYGDARYSRTDFVLTVTKNANTLWEQQDSELALRFSRK